MVAAVGADAVERNAAHLVGILFDEAVAEHADRARIGGNLLDEQIVVLAGFDIGAVLADLGADVLVLVRIAAP